MKQFNEPVRPGWETPNGVEIIQPSVAPKAFGATLGKRRSHSPTLSELHQPSTSRRIETGVGTERYPRLEPRAADCAAKLKKRTLTALYNERPAWLDLAHQKLDAAVAAAYGWPADLTDDAILEKLLALNLERAAEEGKAATVKKPKAQRAKHAEELI